MTKQLTNENFQQEVLRADVPVLVDFWGTWCPPCRKLAPTLDRLAEKADGKYGVGKVNVAEEEALTQRYQVTAIPALFVFKGGEVVRKFVGLQDEATLLRALHEVT